MEIEKLTERLLEDSPDVWPESVKPLRVPLRTVPSATRERIRGLIREAVQEEQQEQSEPFERPSAADEGETDDGKVVPIRKRGWFMAAAAILPVAIGIGAYFLLQPTDKLTLQTVQVLGKVRHTSAGKAADLTTQRNIAEGDKIDVPEDGSVAMKSDQGIFQVKGAANVDFTRIRKTDRDEFDFMIRKGVIAIRSTNFENKSVVWRTGTIVATMTGTVARLSVDPEYQNLEVLEGEFKVKIIPTGETRVVKAGQAIFLPGKIDKSFKAPAARKLEDIEIEDLNNMNNSLKAIEKGEKDPAADRKVKKREINYNKSFENVEQIRAYYGKVFRVIIVERGTYTGYIVEKGNKYILHQADGAAPVEFPKDMVGKITELK